MIYIYIKHSYTPPTHIYIYTHINTSHRNFTFNKIKSWERMELALVHIGSVSGRQGCMWELTATFLSAEAGTHLQYFLVVLRCIESAISNYVFNEFLVVFCWNKGHICFSLIIISKPTLLSLITPEKSSISGCSRRTFHSDNEKTFSTSTQLASALPPSPSLRKVFCAFSQDPSSTSHTTCIFPPQIKDAYSTLSLRENLSTNSH